MIKAYKEHTPRIGNSCYIDNSAHIIGDVEIGDKTSIWPSVVIRGDMGCIRIGNNTNIQDNTTIHNAPGHPVVIGDNVTIGHNCVIHGCTVLGDSIIGMGAIILNGAIIGKHCMVGAGAVVTQDKEIPENSMVLGLPARVVRTLTPDEVEHIEKNSSEYLDLGKDYLSRSNWPQRPL